MIKVMKIEKVLSWKEYRVILFQEIQEWIENSNCSHYTILGYRHLDTKLILHYHDCNRVILFEFNQIGEGYTNEDISKQIQVTAFYTEDFTSEQRIEQAKTFNDRWYEDKPEIKE
jgi:hypothetical protein